MSDPNEPGRAPAVSSAPQAPVLATKKIASRARWITPVLAIVAALVVGLSGGVVIGQASAAAARQGAQTRGQSANGAGAGQGGGGFTSGTIVSINGSSIVVKLADGSQKTIVTSSTTTVTVSASSTIDVLKTGQTISATGTTDSSGNVNAKSVNEGVPLRNGGARANGANSGGATPGATSAGQ